MISIISAIYKSERYLPTFLKHLERFAEVLVKKKFPFEVVIIPTFPSKKELDLLKTVEGKDWCRVHTFDRRGLYAAWNEGVSIARGDIVGPWNVDDIRFPMAVIEARELIGKGHDVVYFPFLIRRYISFGPFSVPVLTRRVDGEVLKFEKRKFETTMTAGPHFMFTKKAYQAVGPFDEQFKIAGDFDWCARAAAAGLSFGLGKGLSGIFRVDGRGLSAGANRTLAAENNIVYMRRLTPEKLSVGYEALMVGYKTGEVLYRGQWRTLR